MHLFLQQKGRMKKKTSLSFTPTSNCKSMSRVNCVFFFIAFAGVLPAYLTVNIPYLKRVLNINFISHSCSVF